MLEIINYTASGLLIILTPLLFSKIVLQRNTKQNKLFSIFLIIISSIIIIFIQLYTSGIVKTIIHCLIYIILIRKIFIIGYSKSLILTIIYITLLIIVDGLAIFISIYIFNIDKDYFYNDYAGTIISNLITYPTTIIITLFIKNRLRKITDYKIDTNKRIVILSAISLICTLFCFYEAFKNITINYNFYINIIIIIVFLTVLFTLIKQIIINNKQEIEYDKLLEFMKTYEIEIENERIQRHETKNQLLTIKSKIYDKEKDYKVINYIDSILDEKIEVSQEHYAKFQYLPANGLKALFYFKTKEAENKNIKVSINISKRVENSLLYNLNTTEFKQLGRLLGIYLDNAIEGSNESDEKKIGIEIYVISNNVEIIISNTYNNQNKINKNGKSTKGKNRGHGLLLANNILNSTNKFISKKEITDKLYIQKLAIKKSTH